MAANLLFEALTYAPDLATSRTLFFDDAELYPHPIQLLLDPPEGDNLGPLSTLPYELLFGILENLPIQSLLNFRNVSKHARYLVDSVPSFHTVMQHVPDLVYTVMVFKPSPYISSATLCKTLAQKECECCHYPAQHIWVPNASRMCLECIGQRPTALQRYEIIRKYHVSDADFSPLDTFTMPCTMMPRLLTHTTHNPPDIWPATKLYEPPYALRETRRRIVSEESPRAFLGGERDIGAWAPLVPKVLPLRQSTRPHTSYDISVSSRRYIPVVMAPWVSKGKVEMGRMCSTCRYTESQDQVYTREGWAQHLDFCRVGEYVDWAYNVAQERKSAHHFTRNNIEDHSPNRTDSGS